MAFPTNDISRFEIADIVANGDDIANEFMSHDHWYGYGILGPGIPLVDVQVRSADTGAIYFDKHVIDTEFRFWNIL